MFCFGHGLSYTRFRYGDLHLSSGHVQGAGHGHLVRGSVSVRNIGERAGDEVVQLYVSTREGSGAPPMVLRSFHRLLLAAGRRRSSTSS